MTDPGDAWSEAWDALVFRARSTEKVLAEVAKALDCKPDMVLHEIGRLLARCAEQESDLKRRAGADD